MKTVLVVSALVALVGVACVAIRGRGQRRDKKVVASYDEIKRRIRSGVVRSQLTQTSTGAVQLLLRTAPRCWPTC